MGEIMGCHIQSVHDLVGDQTLDDGGNKKKNNTNDFKESNSFYLQFEII